MTTMQTESNQRGSVTIEEPVHFVRQAKGKKTLRQASQAIQPKSHVPRITRLLALAHRIEYLIKCGEVADYAQVARLAHVSRARITQIMNLLLLAPDIQEEILGLPSTVKGIDTINERHLREIVKVASWKGQRAIWLTIKGSI